MEKIIVTIPKNDYYSLYAEGELITKESFEDRHELIFNDEAILILYYTFPQHRRVYITCHPNYFNNNNIIKLEGASHPRCVIAQLRARPFDHLKRSLEYIKSHTEYTCYSYPVAFWLQIIALCHAGKTSQYNLGELIKRYKDYI